MLPRRSQKMPVAAVPLSPVTPSAAHSSSLRPWRSTMPAASGQTPRAAADSRPRSVRQQSGRPARSSSIANTSVSHTGAKDSYKPSASARQAAAPRYLRVPARQPPNRCRQASMAASIHKRYPSPMPLWLAYIKISAW